LAPLASACPCAPALGSATQNGPLLTHRQKVMIGGGLVAGTIGAGIGYGWKRTPKAAAVGGGLGLAVGPLVPTLAFLAFLGWARLTDTKIGY
jgi:hypothetical protein